MSTGEDRVSSIFHKFIGILKYKAAWQRASAGLSSREMFVLEHLEDGGLFRFNQFANSNGIRPSSLTNIINRLEIQGLVTRRRDTHDRKAVYLMVSEQGKRIVAQHLIEDTNFFYNLMQRLTQEEQEQLMKLMERMTEIEDYSSLLEAPDIIK